MKNNRKLEVGQVRVFIRDCNKDLEQFVIVSLVNVKDDCRVEIKYLDTWGTDVLNYFVSGKSIIEDTILIM